FDDPSNGLKATVGDPLTFADTAAHDSTQFGTTTSFGISNIGGTEAKVMSFSGYNLPSGISMPVNADANGTGSLVNNWTIVMDLLFPAASNAKWRALMQTDNTGDGDFFVNPANGIGISGQYAGNVTADAWHRIGF